MERKQKIILGALIGVVVLLSVIFLIIILNNKKDNQGNTDVTNENNTEQKIVSQPIAETQNEMNEIINTARGFVEVYFTYSNSSNFSNITEVYAFMTDGFKAKADNVISKYSGNVSADYYAKMTSVTNISIKDKYDKNSNTAIVNVKVAERNVDKNNKETITEKDYVVYMMKKDKWRVEDVKWKSLNIEKSIFDEAL